MNYKYQNILDAKKQQEEALRLQLADLDRRIDRWEQERHNMVQQQRELLNSLNQEKSGAMGGETGSRLARLQALKKQMRQCAASVARLQQKKREVRGELQEVGKSRKLMEEHRDRKREEAEKKLMRKERKISASHAIYSSYNDQASQ